ncbi:S-layer homology domain-containing protein [Cohnella cholangitidis]|uniref:S-layer homology domain-containing protein n=1 Tax=Cohnella cholangitidis TaxID=2598458 RepID=UPI001E4FF965|nr:S-layer homology domain-containing protein [Cohnella cholangitidis]
MKKKSLIWSTVLALGLTSAASFGVGMGSAKTSADFTDLKDLDAATKAKFDAMMSAGVFDGISENTFGLKDEMNRAQFAKVAALIFGLKVDTSLKTSSFTDVQSDSPGFGYALPYIEAIKKAGITEGMGDGTFNPAGEVTKEQLAAFLVRGLGKEKDVEATPDVADQTVSGWAQGYVNLALELKLLNNAPEGTFGGNAPAARELLVTGAFESARTFEETKPLEVSGADFAAGNKLKLMLTVGVDTGSIDLSKITINGVPLDPKLDSFALSEDKKTIIITLHEGFQLDTSKQPVINANGLKTIFGNEMKNEESKPIPVTVTESPVTKPETPSTPSTPEPATNPNSNTDSNSSTGPNSNPNPNPNPNSNTDPNSNPNPNPNPNSNTEPNPNTDPNSNPNPNPNPNPNSDLQ